MDIFPENCSIGLDKSVNLVYNTIMIKNNNNKEKKMIKKMFYSAIDSEVFIIAGCIALIIAGSIFGSWALLQTL